MILPSSSAILVENIKIMRRQKFTSIDTWLNGAQASQNADLFNIAHNGNDIQSLNEVHMQQVN